MNLFGVMDISGSALEAERVRAEVVAANMANAETTKTEQGGPYQRQHVVFTSAAVDQPKNFAQSLLSQSGFSPDGGLGSLGINAPNAGLENPGVKVAAVVSDTSAPLQRYDPGHPDANKNGYVSYPNINPLSEMVDLMGAERSYGMNVSAVTASKNMITATMTILA
jgi:flagellar basal-body rod protein FlgC